MRLVLLSAKVEELHSYLVSLMLKSSQPEFLSQWQEMSFFNFDVENECKNKKNKNVFLNSQ